MGSPHGGWRGVGLGCEWLDDDEGTPVRRTSVRSGGGGVGAPGKWGRLRRCVVAFRLDAPGILERSRADSSGLDPRATSSGWGGTLDLERAGPRSVGRPGFVMTIFGGGVGAIRSGAGLLGDPRTRCLRSSSSRAASGGLEHPRAVERPRAASSGDPQGSGVPASSTGPRSRAAAILERVGSGRACLRSGADLEHPGAGILLGGWGGGFRSGPSAGYLERVGSGSSAGVGLVGPGCRPVLR